MFFKTQADATNIKLSHFLENVLLKKYEHFNNGITKNESELFYIFYLVLINGRDDYIYKLERNYDFKFNDYKSIVYSSEDLETYLRFSELTELSVYLNNKLKNEAKFKEVFPNIKDDDQIYQALKEIGCDLNDVDCFDEAIKHYFNYKITVRITDAKNEKG